MRRYRDAQRSAVISQLPLAVESLEVARRSGACAAPVSDVALDRLATRLVEPSETNGADPALGAAEAHLQDCLFCFNAFGEFVAARESADRDTPFIGRSREMRELQRWFGDASEVGRGAASVVGEAGIGKSRLLREFVRWLRDQAVCVIEASCTADDRVLPHGLVIQILSELCDLPPMASRELVTSRVDSWLRQSRLDPGYLPYLLQVLPIRQDLGPIRNAEPDTLKLRVGTALTRF